MPLFTPTTLGKGAYTKLESRLRRDVQKAATALDNGGARNAAYSSVTALLRPGAREAMLWGKRVGMGGKPVLLTRAEEARAIALADGQAAHLRAWLLSAAPLVKPGGMGIGPRLDMYALSIHAAYQTGMAFGLLQSASNEKGMALYQDDPLWLWERSHAPGIASCSDCMERERRSLTLPYTLTELIGIGFPSSGHTKCLSRCRCSLRLIPAFGGEILAARAHRKAKPTAYHGVVSPDALAAAHALTVGPGKQPK